MRCRTGCLPVLLLLLCACSPVPEATPETSLRDATATPRPAAPPDPTPRDGDLVFQTSLSAQSEAIGRATGSPYTHCGVVFLLDGETRVFEAVQPVRWTSFREWTQRGKGGAYVVRRLRDSGVLTPAVKKQMRALGASWLGKPYDPHFGWSDERLYCSELVYKLYERTTGLRLGPLRKLRDFHLDDLVVRRALQERYGDHIPLDEPVLSPADLHDAEQLVTVGH